MASSRITVFGGSGFLGRQIVKRLAADGAHVRVAVRHPNAHRSSQRAARRADHRDYADV